MRKKELTNRANKKNKNIMKINTKERGLKKRNKLKTEREMELIKHLEEEKERRNNDQDEKETE
jgi:hypothetical protein